MSRRSRSCKIDASRKTLQLDLAPSLLKSSNLSYDHLHDKLGVIPQFYLIIKNAPQFHVESFLPQILQGCCSISLLIKSL